MTDWKPSELPKLSLTWRCSACGASEKSGRNCRIIPIDGADVDEVVCSACDHDDAEVFIRRARAALDVARDLQFERDEVSQALERAGVPFTNPITGEPYKLVERVAVLARWARPKR